MWTCLHPIDRGEFLPDLKINVWPLLDMTWFSQSRFSINVGKFGKLIRAALMHIVVSKCFHIWLVIAAGCFGLSHAVQLVRAVNLLSADLTCLNNNISIFNAEVLCQSELLGI